MALTVIAMVASSRMALYLPFTSVPITMQVFVVVLSGLLLGSGASVAQACFWVVLGSGGMIAASGISGPGALFGPTGGYLIAFPFATLAIGIISERSKSPASMILASAVGLLIIYTLGAIWLSFFVHGLGKAVTFGVLPFVLADIAKCALAIAIASPYRIKLHRWLEGGA
ncbi:MAG: biotin transporter BioY [Patescibacteria group bacterium]